MKKLALLLSLILLTPCVCLAQTTAPVITAAASAERMRFTAPSSVVQMHLQVYAETGQTVFDVTSKGNVLDWTMQAGSGEHLIPGSYLCVVTVKSLSGRLSQRIASVLVQEKQVELQRTDSAALSAAQQQAVGPIEENAALTILKANEAEAVTALSNHNGEGQIIRDRGALSFRLGDFFRGEDKEQMRLTEEGNLGIGTGKPQAKLDVAGTVRASEGFRFSDGTTLKADNGKLSVTNSAGDPLPGPNAAGTGTQNQLAKWAESGGSGTLTDSVVTESSGRIGIGTTTPTVKLDLVDNNSGAGGFQLANFTNGPTAQLQNRLVNNNNAYAYYGLTSSAYNQAPILANRAFFGSYNVDTVIWTQTANNILFATNGIGTNSERMRITPAGNVGIGTTTPAAKLHVAGNVNFTGLRTETGGFAPNVIGGHDANTITASVYGATISGGGAPFGPNSVTGYSGTVGGGSSNSAGQYATVGGGSQNTASGEYSTVPGGVLNIAQGNYSFAAGTHAKAEHGGSFVWSDITSGFGFFASTAPNQFLINATGGVGIGTNAPAYRLDVVGRTRIRQNAGGTGGTNSAGLWLFQNTPAADRAFVGMESDNSVGFFGGNGADWGLIMNTQTGRVGIGTTAPEQALHVNGNSEVLSTGNGSGFKFRDRGSASSNDDWVWYSSGNIARFFRAGAGDLLFVSTAGNLGVGASSPTAKLQVAGGDAAITTQGNGLILRATDGPTCYRLTVSHGGMLSTTPVTCP